MEEDAEEDVKEDEVCVGWQKSKKKDANVNVDGGCECVCVCECAWVCSNAIDVYVADVGAWQCLGARIEAAT